MTMYGFVVMAWLILIRNEDQMAVPFATFAACEMAREEIVKNTSRSSVRQSTCVETGASK